MPRGGDFINLFEIFGTIKLNDDGFSKGISDAAKKAESFGSKVGNVLEKVGKIATVSLGAGATAFGALSIKALKAGGDLEQQLGGAEAVFGNFAKTAIDTSKTAFETAGLSANDYLATINKMGALMQGSGLEQKKSLDLSAAAMQRAADVASIMGIDTTAAMESVAGAAKGNFTMMDNLGVAMNATTIEAYALSKGIKISYAEMDNAQKVGLAMEMFLEKTAYAAGNYAKENETLAGSLSTARAALTNFLSGAGDVDALVSSIGNMVEVVVGKLQELLPRLTKGLTDIVRQLIPMIPPLLQTILPALIEGASALINGIVAELPALIGVLIDAMPMVVEAILTMLPLLAQAAIDIVVALADGIAAMLPELIPVAINAIITIVKTLIENIDLLIDAAINIILALVDGLIDNLDLLIDAAPEIIVALVGAIIKAAPKIFEAAGHIIEKLIEGLRDSFGKLSEMGEEIIYVLSFGILGKSPDLVKTGKAAGEAFGEAWGAAALGTAGEYVNEINTMYAGFEVLRNGGRKEEYDARAEAEAERKYKLAEERYYRLNKRKQAISKETHDEITENQSSNLDEQTKATEKAFGLQTKATKDAFSEAKLLIQDYRNETDYLASEELKMWEILANNYEKGSKERVEVDREMAKLREGIAKEEFNNSKKWIETRKFFGLMSLGEEIAAWERVQARYLEGTAEREEADRNLYTLRNKLATEQENIDKKMLEAGEKYAKSLEDRAKSIFNAFDLFKSLSSTEEQRAEKAASAREKLIAIEEKINSLNWENAEDYEKIIREEEKLLEEQAKVREELRKAEIEASKSQAQLMLENAREQLKIAQDYAKNLVTLATKGIDEGLLAEKSKEEIAEMVKMTETQLKEYSSIWEEGQALAREMAIKELAPLKKETDDIIAGLADEKLALNTGKKIGQGIVTGISETLNTISIPLNVIGSVTPEASSAGVPSAVETFSNNFDGIKDNVLTKLSEMSEKALEILRKMVSRMDIFLTTEGYNVGKSFVGALGQAMIDQKARLHQQALEIASSIRSAFSDEYAMSGYNAVAGSSGVVSPVETSKTFNTYIYGVPDDRTAFEAYRAIEKAAEVVFR